MLGCTEIPLIVRADDCPLRHLDSARLLARAALRKALEAALLAANFVPQTFTLLYYPSGFRERFALRTGKSLDTDSFGEESNMCIRVDALSR